MRVRKLDPNGDFSWGHGQSDFLVNTPQAVGQCVQTRLELYTGDWFLNLAEGTPWRTQVVGKRTESTRDPAVRARILGTQGVTGLDTYASQSDRGTRGFAVQATVNTIYGKTIVATPVSAANVDVRQGR